MAACHDLVGLAFDIKLLDRAFDELPFEGAGTGWDDFTAEDQASVPAKHTVTFVVAMTDHSCCNSRFDDWNRRRAGWQKSHD